MRSFGIAALAAIVLATPASATRFELIARGILVQSGAPDQTLTGLPFTTGSNIGGRWIIDIDRSTPLAVTPPGSPTTGEARFLLGAVSSGFMQIQSTAGEVVLQQGSGSAGALYALNDVAGGGINSQIRVDQLTITDGARVSPGGLLFGYDNNIGAALPSGVFLAGLAFGRVANGPVAIPPTMLTSLDNLDPYTVFQSGPYFMSLSFRQGSATTQAQLQALPLRGFAVANLNVFLNPLAAVPEPSSWAMLIAGFGLIGAAQRRRRTAAA